MYILINSDTKIKFESVPESGPNQPWSELTNELVQISHGPEQWWSNSAIGPRCSQSYLSIGEDGYGPLKMIMVIAITLIMSLP